MFEPLFFKRYLQLATLVSKYNKHLKRAQSQDLLTAKEMIPNIPLDLSVN